MQHRNEKKQVWQIVNDENNNHHRHMWTAQCTVAEMLLTED